MNIDLLRTALEAAASAWSEPGYFLPLVELATAQESPDTAEPRTVALLAALRAEPELEVFHEKVHTIGGKRHTPDHKDIANWLIWRASETTTEQALDDLATYLAANEFECIHTLVLQGLTPDASCEFDGNITLLPWESFPDSGEKHRIEHDLAGQPPYGTLVPPSSRKPTGALVHRCKAKIVISKEADADWRPCETPPQVSDLRDALMCIGLTLPPAPQVLGCWTKYPHWVPLHEPRGHEIAGTSHVREFPTTSTLQAKNLFTAFRARNREIQAHLRLVMERVSRMERERIVDAAIDLGIALEALYLSDLSDDRGELTFRLKIRAARFLGTDAADRKRIFDLVGKLYGLRSTAVHTGELKGQASSFRQLLHQGFRLGVDTVRKFILNGEPNWNAVQFS